MNVLDVIEARAAAATPGPWKLWGMTVMADPLGNSNVDEAEDIARTSDPDRGLRTFNANFIAHARDDVPKLAAALRAAEAVHNADGGRWEGFPRAVRKVAYCTHCQKEAPCPTITAIRDALA